MEQNKSHKSFELFVKQWYFIQEASRLDLLENNGFVERANQNIKKTLWNYRENENDPYLAMLALQAASNSNNTLAFLILMNIKLRTFLIPSINNEINLE